MRQSARCTPFRNPSTRARHTTSSHLAPCPKTLHGSSDRVHAPETTANANTNTRLSRRLRSPCELARSTSFRHGLLRVLVNALPETVSRTECRGDLPGPSPRERRRVSRSLKPAGHTTSIAVDNFLAYLTSLASGWGGGCTATRSLGGGLIISVGPLAGHGYEAPTFGFGDRSSSIELLAASDQRICAALKLSPTRRSS